MLTNGVKTTRRNHNQKKIKKEINLIGARDQPTIDRNRAGARRKNQP